MKLSEKQWARFGKAMAFLSGIIFLLIAFYWEKNIVSILLRVWGAFVGFYLIFLSLHK